MRHAALVVVRLHSAEPGQESHFDGEMTRRHWVPYPNLPASYLIDFEGADSDDELIEATEADIAAAAEAAFIYDWDATLVLNEDDR